MPNDGILWKGRPPFLSDVLLGQLAAELNEHRPIAAEQKWGQYICPGGPAVQEFTSSRTSSTSSRASPAH